MAEIVATVILLAPACVTPCAAAETVSTEAVPREVINAGKDYDGDRMPDIWEARFGLNPYSAADAAFDRDGDGLDNAGEFASRSDPNNVDTDHDGLTDGEEVNKAHSNPRNADTDGDQLGDFWEVFYGMDPTDPGDAMQDLDNDGYSNREEILAGTDPCDASSSPIWDTPPGIEPLSVATVRDAGTDATASNSDLTVAENCKPNALADSEPAMPVDADKAPPASVTTAAVVSANGDTPAQPEETASETPPATGDTVTAESAATTGGTDDNLDLAEAATLGMLPGDAGLPEPGAELPGLDSATGTAIYNPPPAENSLVINSPVAGHERVVDVPRLEPANDPGIAPVIDGNLNDPAWRQASESFGFWNSIQNSRPSNQTEVLVMMDEQNLYFGFRMYESDVGAIQATREVRDVGLGYDDSIMVQLDPFFNRRDISEFSLNALGTQSDEIAGGRSAKIEWKGDWQGSARKTDYGWEAEMAIPLAILNFNKGTNRFGVNFRRYQSRTREYTYWADITPQSREEEMGQLRGLILPALEEKKVWSFMPFALAGKDIPDKEGEVQDTLVTAGIDIRYQPRPDLTGLLSLNPDFSQVEEAVADISFSYNERSIDDNRPFFVEGADFISDPEDDEQYFYSNRVPDFDAGIKSFGRVGRSQYGALATVAPDSRIDFAGRTLFEVDDTNSAIGTVITTSQPDFDNTLLVAQFNGRQPSGLKYAADVAYTDTSNVTDPEDTPEGGGSHLMGLLGWGGDHFYIKGEADKYETEYFPANARLNDDLLGTQGLSMTTGWYEETSHPLFQTVEGYVGGRYRETEAGEKQQDKVYASGSVEFQNNMRVGLFGQVGPYRPEDGRGIFEEEFNNDRYYSVFTDFNTRSSKFSGGLQYDWGDLGGGPYKYYSGYGWWRPINPLYFSLSAERTDSFGISDQVVAVVAWNITPENALAGRYIYSDGENIYRLAYSYRPRKGLDIFAVFDTDTTAAYEFSVKLVKIF